MEARRSFMLYTSQYETIKKLSTEQKAELLDAIFLYHRWEEQALSQIVDIVFTSFQEQFKIDDEKYQKICERNATNGQKWWRPPIVKTWPNKPKRSKQSEEQDKNPVGSLGTQDNPKKPKKPDDDNDDDNDDDDIVISKDITKKDTTIVVSKSAQPVKNSFEEAEQLFDMLEQKIESGEIVDNEARKFHAYWTAPMKSGKQYWRTQKTFAFRARWATWMDKAWKADTHFNSWPKKRWTAQAK